MCEFSFHTSFVNFVSFVGWIKKRSKYLLRLLRKCIFYILSFLSKVTDVSPLSGPPELLQLSMEAARQWQFEAPPKAPVFTQIQMTYSLTKACPEGKGMDAGDIVTTIEPTDEKKGDLRIVGKLYQPWPPYPEVASAQRRRGQLYLSIVVNPDGSVSDVRITKAVDELLDKSAVETVRTWRFKVSPGTRPTKFSVTLSFRIPCLDR